MKNLSLEEILKKWKPDSKGNFDPGKFDIQDVDGEIEHQKLNSKLEYDVDKKENVETFEKVKREYYNIKLNNSLNIFIEHKHHSYHGLKLKDLKMVSSYTVRLTEGEKEILSFEGKKAEKYYERFGSAIEGWKDSQLRQRLGNFYWLE